MNNVEPMKLTKKGVVKISREGIQIEGFASKNASCREASIMACAWAIGELQREMLKCIERPGGGNVSVD
ncbi:MULTISPECIES: hypothetical protein [unclassified Pseudomonas]|uniref:hypothetical protein n=1 Tax=unclassified Pseudomonas TaxID=196821 RepID=UPI00244AE292|nr:MULTISPECIES: hypothetical protein [unclassified Pseudomonas]MDG9928288.1 hypothetical protein [Pseudomonas sp. GD04042]MDH0481148.1 hypothetical protein [Pseudomonas sp. GD04015]MDH0604484.1 hypothetical protein [Pseudomonas sp. GD03869]